MSATTATARPAITPLRESNVLLPTRKRLDIGIVWTNLVCMVLGPFRVKPKKEKLKLRDGQLRVPSQTRMISVRLLNPQDYLENIYKTLK